MCISVGQMRLFFFSIVISRANHCPINIITVTFFCVRFDVFLHEDFSGRGWQEDAALPKFNFSKLSLSVDEPKVDGNV